MCCSSSIVCTETRRTKFDHSRNYSSINRLDNAAHARNSSATVTHTSHKQAAGRPGFFASLGAILATLSRRRTPPRAACSAAVNRRSRRCRPPAAHCRWRTALPTASDGIGAVGPAQEGPAATPMRSGEREQNSPLRKARTRQASARSRPIALGLALTARCGGASSSMVMGSSGWQQGTRA